MDCENYEALAVDLLYGEISPEKRADASAHAAGCAECGKLSKELDEARQTAASLPSRINPPAELDERVMLAARMAADVRKQPLRGSGLHVAAAAVLAACLVGVSFVVGMNVGRPPTRILGQDPIAINPKNGDGTLINDMHGGGGPPRVRDRNTDAEQWKTYLDATLSRAAEDFAKGDHERAIQLFGAVYSSGGRTQMALEARIGMAKCYRALGKLEDARGALREAREKNMDWGTNFNEVEREASKLIVEINAQILERDKKKLEEKKLTPR